MRRPVPHYILQRAVVLILLGERGSPKILCWNADVFRAAQKLCALLALIGGRHVVFFVYIASRQGGDGG